ncbi:GTPase IMAP family member 8-like isoform X1 [Colossoma macropomum]|uniref:GTPase IMAP family member 8-like isoform X1 n=1 Tax=Colossoma macropomum TaxID=42526 RepID=UPI0018649823|nr:GTPase IMAP family member 8-like isoform X1 [Colossoma macropomum]
MGQAEAKPEPGLLSRGRLRKRIKEHLRGKSAGRSGALQLVLVGPKGSGKSSAGNSILGKKAFKTGTAILTCQTEKCEIGGRAVTLVDTPGLTGKETSDLEVMGIIRKACQDLLELPVVFLLVLPLEWNMKRSEDGQHMLRHALGKVSVDHLMVLVTHTDQVEQDGSEEESVLRKGGSLQLTVRQCGGWFHLFSIAKSDGTQVLELVDKLDRMMREGRKTQKLYASSEEQTAESSKASDQFKVTHQEAQKKKKTPKPEPHSLEEDKRMGTERAGGMYSVRKNLQQLEDQMKSKREEEEELMRGRNSEYKAQLQKIREKIVTLKA